MRTSKLLMSFLVLGLAFATQAADAPARAQAGAAFAGNKLQNTQWRLASFGGPRLDTPVRQGTTVTLKFGADGRATGSGGCNSYSATFTEEGNLLSFRQIISTKRACINQGANQQEQLYFASLESGRTFMLSGDRLTIFSGDRRRSLNFVPDPASATQTQKYDNQSSPVDLLASFYNAVNNRDFARAYRYWESPATSLENFANGYQGTVKVELIVQPPTNVEGAAGSLYAEIPTVIVAAERDGSERVFVGCYTARASNVGRASKVWRIHKASVGPAPVDAIAVLLRQACRN